MPQQLRLSELPRTCTAIARLDTGERCGAPATHVLVPGPTGHCEIHSARGYAQRAWSWQDAFAKGRARIIEIGDLESQDWKGTS